MQSQNSDTFFRLPSLALLVQEGRKRCPNCWLYILLGGPNCLHCIYSWEESRTRSAAELSFFYREAVGRGRDRGPNSRKAGQLENVKYCVWWRRKRCRTMSWTKCWKNWPRRRLFKPWFTTFWSLQSRRPQRAGFRSRYSQKIRAKAAFKTDENEKTKPPKGWRGSTVFTRRFWGFYFFPRHSTFVSPLPHVSACCCRLQDFVKRAWHSAQQLRIIVCDFVEVCDQERLFSIDADVYFRLSSFVETRWKIFQRKPSFFIDHIGRDTLFEICSISGKCLLIIFRLGMSCSAKNLSASWRPFYVSFLMSPSMDSNAPENTKLVIIIVQGDRPLFVPQPIRQQPCPHQATCNGCCGSSILLTLIIRYPSNAYLVFGDSIFSESRRSSFARATLSSVSDSLSNQGLVIGYLRRFQCFGVEPRKCIWVCEFFQFPSFFPLSPARWIFRGLG